jgi:hypothetical protein
MYVSPCFSGVSFSTFCSPPNAEAMIMMSTLDDFDLILQRLFSSFLWHGATYFNYLFAEPHVPGERLCHGLNFWLMLQLNFVLFTKSISHSAIEERALPQRTTTAAAARQ